MRAWKYAVLSLVLVALAISAECAWLCERQRAQRIASANGQVEEKLAAARIYLNAQHWNEAIRQLDDALDVEGATNRDTVEPVLEEAQRGQAEALLDAANAALAQRRSGDALHLLRAYLANPHAVHVDRARTLHSDLERALSDEEADRLLARLSDEALTVFAESGELTIDDGLHAEAMRSLFRETLRRNVAKEMRKREARREVARLTAKHRAAERDQRIARLRNNPVFHSLTSFLTRTLEQLRDRQRLAARQEAELRELFRQLGVKNAAEQEQIRNDLLERPTTENIREQLERKRVEIKRAYRDEPHFNRADGELFDQLVDYEVDQFLKMLPSS